MGTVARRSIGRPQAKDKPTTHSRGRRLKSPFDFGTPGGPDSHVLPFVPPLLLLPIVGALLRHYADESAMVWVPILISVVAVALATLAYHQAHARRMLLRVHVSVSVYVAIESLAVHMVVGPFGNSTWAWLWIIIGCAWAVSWIIPRTDSVRGNGSDTHAKTGLDEMLGVPGATARRIETTPFRERWRVHLKGGQDASDMQSAATQVTSRRSLPPGSVQVHASRKHADEAYVTVVKKDALARPIRWPGPSAPGASIAEPLITGLYEDGEPVTYNLIGRPDPENPQAAPAVGATVGMPGAGKTFGAMVEVGEVLSRNDVVVWWADPIKGAQSVKPILSALDWFVSTVPRCEQMLHAVDRLIPIRAEYLGSKGLDMWVKGCGIPFLYVHLEEASRVIPDSDYFTQLTQAVRSVGIFLDTSQQRASANTFDTDARHNLGLVRCYGVGDDKSAGMVLSDDVLDAGVRPEVWRNDFPGRHVIQAPSIPQSRWPITARSFYATKEQLAQVASQARRVSLSDAEIHALGVVYTSRKRYDDEEGSTAVANLMMPPQWGTPDEEDETVPPIPEELLEGLDDIDPRAEIDTDGVSVDLSDVLTPGAEMTVAQRHSAFIGIVADLLASESEEVTAADFVGRWLAIPGMTLAQRPALQGRLTRMCALGAAVRVSHGRYRLERNAVAVLQSNTDSDDDDEREWLP
jgi:hypothetical protein